MKFLIASAIAISIMISTHWAMAADGKGSGMANCSELISLYDHPEADDNFRSSLSFGTTQWALGYMSGLNKYTAVNRRRDLSPYDTLSLFEKIMNECRHSPSSRIIDVVAKLYLALPYDRPGTS